MNKLGAGEKLAEYADTGRVGGGLGREGGREGGKEGGRKTQVVSYW